MGKQSAPWLNNTMDQVQSQEQAEIHNILSVAMLGFSLKYYQNILSILIIQKKEILRLYNTMTSQKTGSKIPKYSLNTVYQKEGNNENIQYLNITENSFIKTKIF